MRNSSTINEITVSYKKMKVTNKRIGSSLDSYEAIREIMIYDNCELDVKEYFYVLYLNRSNSIIGYYRLSEGGLTGTLADIRLAFATALKTLATAVVLAHNHPSGNRTPSEADILLTNKFRDAGQLLDVVVIDHLVVADNNYHSFADGGLL